MKIGRNDPCPCGSGKKYKKCCLERAGTAFIPDIDTINALLQVRRPEPHLNLVPSVAYQGHRIRSIWNRLYFRPINETFHEFLLIILMHTFGEEWYKSQKALDPDERHVALKWLEAFDHWKERMTTDENKKGEHLWGALPSGEVQALMSLAYDLFCLQTINKPPDFLIKKLRNRSEFQGVRYEIAVAAVISRAGFEIEFLDDTILSSKHCDFIATHRQTGIRIAVEAKSRRRKGVIHEKGVFNSETDAKGDVSRLFSKALSQKPDDMPYLIFVDLNLPMTPELSLEEKPWFKDVYEMMKRFGTPTPEKPDPFNALVLTNFCFYYFGNEESCPAGEWCVVISKHPQAPLDGVVLDAIFDGLNRYSDIPSEV